MVRSDSILSSRIVSYEIQKYDNTKEMPQTYFAYISAVYTPNRLDIQSNRNSSNIDGSLNMANLNLFLSPYEILPIALENKYLRKFSYFIMKLYVACTH